MTQAYSNPERADDPHALPDIEVFYIDDTESVTSGLFNGRGWYWWPCFPGCLPDSEPNGPFDTQLAALIDMRKMVEEVEP